MIEYNNSIKKFVLDAFKFFLKNFFTKIKSFNYIYIINLFKKKYVVNILFFRIFNRIKI